ncbi:2-succinyl-6-hydroxy-2,4-cyclohexadiene-1-carboxylate synthase [Halalkalibacillus halophilus]|uniref:2-succinyl-6-hydroxy-2, 4-cyclohexadiene-1-carboxylate synthase n=1 Tax=Halalkalibacillus halophilus TaxID=392827 RepID=UPI0004268763|nr:2-succinyl-6-hydroxy-2,4-cyclohexadiene-1-carboxylate synthase [Halalkalibacillus halophilus]
MFIEVGENKYHVQVYGEGPPVIFLHGFTGKGTSWDTTIDCLKTDFKCITVDLPGHGLTETKEINSMEEVVTDLKEVLVKLKLQKVHLIGYSMGGRTALVFVSMYPEWVDQLVLIGASPGLENDQAQERIERDEKLAERILKNGVESFVKNWEKTPLFESQQYLPEDTKLKLREERLSQSAEGLALSLKSMGTGRQPNIWPKLKNINQNVLLITGQFDEKFTNMNEKMLQYLPNATHKSIPAVGHAVQLERPTAVVTEVNKFLDT